jgi:hypothetical protein
MKMKFRPLVFYGIPAGFILMQSVCVFVFLHHLLHFSDSPWWSQAINCLVLPLSVHSIYKLGRTVIGIHLDMRKHKRELARWKSLQKRGRHIQGPEELARYIADIEELDPAMAADLRENLKEFLPK